MQSLLDNGTDVMVAETDAVWLNNPFPALQELEGNNVDIISSRATLPGVVNKALGASLCTVS